MTASRRTTRGDHRAVPAENRSDGRRGGRGASPRDDPRRQPRHRGRLALLLALACVLRSRPPRPRRPLPMRSGHAVTPRTRARTTRGSSSTPKRRTSTRAWSARQRRKPPPGLPERDGPRRAVGRRLPAQTAPRARCPRAPRPSGASTPPTGRISRACATTATSESRTTTTGSGSCGAPWGRSSPTRRATSPRATTTAGSETRAQTRLLPRHRRPLHRPHRGGHPLHGAERVALLCDYTYARPCGDFNGPLSLDTARYGNGAHAVEIRTTDAAGNEASETRTGASDRRW